MAINMEKDSKSWGTGWRVAGESWGAKPLERVGIGLQSQGDYSLYLP